MERRHPSVVNADEVAPLEGPRRGAYASSFRPLGHAAGSQQLGCSLYEVAPGSAAYPFHCHLGNEEALIVLSGTGTLRLGDREVPVRAGDYVAFPAGPSHAHQLRNTGSEPLRYYALSTMKYPEVVQYPDSEKVGVAWVAEGARMRLLFQQKDGGATTDDYFRGDPLAKEPR